MQMDVKVVKEANGSFRVYVDNKPAIELPTQFEAEKLAAFLRQQINGATPPDSRGHTPDDEPY